MYPRKKYQQIMLFFRITWKKLVLAIAFLILEMKNSILFKNNKKLRNKYIYILINIYE